MIHFSIEIGLQKYRPTLDEICVHSLQTAQRVVTIVEMNIHLYANQILHRNKIVQVNSAGFIWKRNQAMLQDPY